MPWATSSSTSRSRSVSWLIRPSSSGGGFSAPANRSSSRRGIRGPPPTTPQLRTGLDPATVNGDPFPHPDQAVTAGGHGYRIGRQATTAVVGHLDLDGAGRVPQPYRGVGGRPGVAQHIGQRLLD